MSFHFTLPVCLYSGKGLTCCFQLQHSENTNWSGVFIYLLLAVVHKGLFVNDI